MSIGLRNRRPLARGGRLPDLKGMPAAVVACPTLEELAASVRTVLCERDKLDPSQTPLFRTPLLKGGKPCGYVFHIEGPRLLKTSAIWSATADRVIFYDSTGTRFHEVKLSESPDLAEKAMGRG